MKAWSNYETEKIKKKKQRIKKVERIELLFTISVLSDINNRKWIIENGGMIKGQKKKQKNNQLKQ